MSTSDIAQFAALLISAAGVAATIFWSRVLARRRATLDMLLFNQTNLDSLSIRADFVAAMRENTLAELMSKER